MGGSVVLHWFSRSCISLTRADPSAVLHRCCSSICLVLFWLSRSVVGVLFGFCVVPGVFL